VRVTDDTLLGYLRNSPWERMQEEVPAFVADDISDAVDALTIDLAFDELPGEETQRVEVQS
jgi:hypothetical protein